MKITWLGHASFLIESEEGIKIVTDPFEAGSYDGAVGYDPIDTRADIVTVSHDHADHNYVDAVKGEPEVVRRTGAHDVKGIPIEGFPVYHDECRGEERGRNTIYVMEVDGVRICHLGDLGHSLSEESAKAVGEVDVLFLPVGGYYTIGPSEAKAIADRLGAKLILPMHYKTDALGFPIQPVDDFLRLVDSAERTKGRTLEFSKADIPDKPKVVVLNYS